MLADSRQFLRLAIACIFLAGSAVTAGDDELPDIEFLEYLGSWEESDEDWVLISDSNSIREELAKDERSDPVPQGDESTETEDEG